MPNLIVFMLIRFTSSAPGYRSLPISLQGRNSCLVLRVLRSPKVVLALDIRQECRLVCIFMSACTTVCSSCFGCSVRVVAQQQRKVDLLGSQRSRLPVRQHMLHLRSRLLSYDGDVAFEEDGVDIGELGAGLGAGGRVEFVVEVASDGILLLIQRLLGWLEPFAPLLHVVLPEGRRVLTLTLPICEASRLTAQFEPTSSFERCFPLLAMTISRATQPSLSRFCTRTPLSYSPIYSRVRSLPTTLLSLYLFQTVRSLSEASIASTRPCW
jgi:hypothetical protein